MSKQHLKRRVTVNLKEYEESYASHLDGLKHRLVEATKDSSITTKTLGALVGQLVQFQEELLGLHSTSPKRFPKIPAALFKNYDPYGPLFTILHTVLEFKKNSGLRKLDFTTQSTKADVYVNLLETIRQQLQLHGQLRPPRVFLTNTFGQEERKHLIRLIITHHGQLVQTPAEATHLVFKDDKPASEEEKYGEEYIRTLERGPRSVFVHFWYYPDSYDTWMPLNEVEGEPQEPEVITPPAQWMVTDRWILDMIPFDEWMNEADYEPAHITNGQPTPQHVLVPNTDLALVAHVSAPAIQAPPKLNIVASSIAASPAAASTATPKARGRTNKKENLDDSMNVDDDDEFNAPRRGGRKRGHSEITDGDYDEEDGAKRAKGAAASTRGVRVNTQGKNTLPAQMVPRGPAAATKQGQARKEQLTKQMNAFVSNLSNAYALVVASTPQAAGGNQPSLVLPSHAEWFNINTIHEFEKRALSEFFNPESANTSKTPEIYKEYRDFMIHTYQQNPSVYLTFTACRRSLSGDALAVKSVFEFLEQVGLINYAVAPESCSVYAAPRQPSAKAPASQHLWRTDPPPTLRTAPYSVLHAQPGAVTADVNLTLRKFITGGIEDAKTTVYMCSQCHEVCKHLRYDHVKNASSSSSSNVTLCKNCYASGLYPSAEMTSNDFSRVDMLLEASSAAVASTDSTSWTEEETLKLLEGIEQHGQDWDRVSAHVASKSAEQCLAHFLRMPIEDPFTQNQVLSASHVVKSEKTATTPFSNLANPLMSMLVFLREAVSPAAAAAAAQGALKSLMTTEFPRQQQMLEKRGDAMEVDEKPSGPEDPEFLLNIRSAAASALSAASLKAAVMAEREEREIERLVHKVVEAQIKKVELKVKYFDELDRVLKDESAKIDRARSHLMQERLNFEEQKKAAQQPTQQSADTK
eukprot:TRINITY_DN8196_c0_g1_i1.p1 TRINITY_DN8196_c0_g1~~TRINITY_DN8196_c0_g1_i1.p1  ORF type:complete len:921 (-),score=291.48 TRINITY_DN8196_c0_g1_i1:88-2850(-)